MENTPKRSLAEVYDTTYTEHKEAFGGGNPEAFVLEAAELVPKGGRVLEYGAGQGRNALALAERGFTVHANDLSPIGVASMNEAAKEKGLSAFTAEIADAREDLEGSYDLIVSTFVLHHLTHEEAVACIEKMKEHTNEGGLNAIAVLTNEKDLAREDPAYFYPDVERMRELYADWEMVSYVQQDGIARRGTNPDGSPKLNVSVKMVARKPVQSI